MPDTVVIIGPAHPLRGGLASYNERLAREFRHHGDRVVIFTFSLQYPEFLFPGTTQYSSEPAPDDLDIRIAINSINPFNWIHAGREIRKVGPTIVVVRYWLPFMGPCLGTILRIVRRNRKTKIICISDNIIPHEKRPGDTLFTRYFIPAVDGFITMSKKVLSDLQGFTKTKPAEFVPHPLYDNFGELVPRSSARAEIDVPLDKKVILFFGFIRPYKGLDLLLEAMADPRFVTQDIYLLIAGEFYEDSSPYLDLIRRLGIGGRIILRTEFIPDSRVKYYLCAADLVVQPYRHATQSGVTPLAYHFERPMVVTRVGALPDMVPDGEVGLIAEPSSDSLADQIIRYFEMGENHFIPHIRAEKKKYTWARMEKMIKQVADAVQK